MSYFLLNGMRSRPAKCRYRRKSPGGILAIPASQSCHVRRATPMREAALACVCPAIFRELRGSDTHLAFALALNVGQRSERRYVNLHAGHLTPFGRLGHFLIFLRLCMGGPVALSLADNERCGADNAVLRGGFLREIIRRPHFTPGWAGLRRLAMRARDLEGHYRELGALHLSSFVLGCHDSSMHGFRASVNRASDAQTCKA